MKTCVTTALGTGSMYAEASDACNFNQPRAIALEDTQIRVLCAHEHTVLRRICTHRGLGHNLPVKYTIVRTYARI